MMDQKYRVRVNREPLVSGDRSSVRKKRWIVWGSIAGVVLILLIVGLIFLGGRNTSVDTGEPTATAQLTLHVDRGSAQVKGASDQDFTDATDGMQVGQGATVRTESDSFAILALTTGQSGSAVRLNSDSRVEITQVAADKLSVKLLSGETWATVDGTTPPSTAINTSDARVEAQSTSFDVEADESKTIARAIANTSAVTAVDTSGSSGQSTDKGTLSLKEDKETTIKSDNLPETESDFDTKNISDDFKNSLWYRWNSEQDQSFSAGLSGAEDTDGPTLRITEPKDGDETDKDKIEIKGVTDLSATVKIEGESVDTKDGEFSQKVDLKEGDNTITIIATDPSGNETKKELTIVRKPAKPDAVSVTLSTSQAGSILVSWNESDTKNFGSYSVKRNEQVLQRFTDKSTTEYRDEAASAGTTYTYNVCVTDGDGQETCSQDQSATAKGEPNKAPSVSITSPADGSSVKGGTAISFGCDGSDPDGDTLIYTWEFGDGISTTGKNVSHTYSVVASKKSYQVKVTVVDRAGAAAASSVWISVTP